MTTQKKPEPEENAVKDAVPVGAPRQPGTPVEASAPKAPGTASREPQPKRDDEVKVALLDSNRQEIRRVMIPASEAGAFRIQVEGQWFERVGKTADDVATYALST